MDQILAWRSTPAVMQWISTNSTPHSLRFDDVSAEDLEVVLVGFPVDDLTRKFIKLGKETGAVFGGYATHHNPGDVGEIVFFVNTIRFPSDVQAIAVLDCVHDVNESGEIVSFRAPAEGGILIWWDPR